MSTWDEIMKEWKNRSIAKYAFILFPLQYNYQVQQQDILWLEAVCLINKCLHLLDEFMSQVDTNGIEAKE